ncbi:MAG TPA: methyltransferase domain-containing protein [Pseudonocardia sp.]|nr:methyltransferase domain-containing protein [Pseudonocardia sp.]
MTDEARHPADTAAADTADTATATAVTDEAELCWEQHYRDQAQHWSGRPNAVLPDVVGSRAPGRALDLGCGEALWLAGQGWQVTAVDISSTAVERVRAQAERDGLGDRVRTERHNLARSLPADEFDLISAQYLHTPIELARSQVLRAATGPDGPTATVTDHVLAVGRSRGQEKRSGLNTSASTTSRL